MNMLRYSAGVFLLATAVGGNGQSEGALQKNHRELREESREIVDVHRKLGFFVNGGRNRSPHRARGSRRYRTAPYARSSEGPPFIDRERDPLEEGGWERKRVDMIRPSSVAAPTLSPIATLSPTPATPVATESPTFSPNTTESPTSPPNTTEVPQTPVPTATATSPATVDPTSAGSLAPSTAAPTVASTTGNTTGGLPRTSIPTLPVTGTNDTTSLMPDNAITIAPSAAGVTNDTAVIENNTTVGDIAADPFLLRSFDYQSMMKSNDVVCTGGQQDFSFGVELKVNFPEQQFKACTESQFEGLKTIIETTMNLAFPTTVSSWPDKVKFRDFDFDVAQFSLHINPFGGVNEPHRHLLRRDSLQGHVHYYEYVKDEDFSSNRRSLQETSCPNKPTLCSSSTDVCMYGCGTATVNDCGDFIQWSRMGSSLALAVAAQSLECLGGLDPPMIDVFLLQ